MTRPAADAPLPSASDHVDIALDAAGVATLTLTGNGALNIVDSAIIADATRAIRELGRHAPARVLVLRGAGERAFVGGADINEMATLTPQTARTFISGLRGLCDAVRESRLPVVARLSGWCLGGGLELAMSCDLRIAARDAKFGMPEVLVGIPSVIQATLMPRLIGGSRAAWLLMTGESIDATKAADWGLVHEAVEADALDRRVAELAGRLAMLGPAVAAQQKALMRSWEQLPLEAAIDASVGQFALAFTTGEPQRFMGEFLARKKKR